MSISQQSCHTFQTSVCTIMQNRNLMQTSEALIIALLTSSVIAKLSTNHMSIHFISYFIANSSPFSIEVYLHSSLPTVGSSHQTNISTFIGRTFRRIKYSTDLGSAGTLASGRVPEEGVAKREVRSGGRALLSISRAFGQKRRTAHHAYIQKSEESYAAFRLRDV